MTLSLLRIMSFSALGFVSSLAAAQGALDWADPCVDAKKTFKSNSEAARSRTDQVIREWDARKEPPGEMRGLYVEAIREGAFKAWSDDPTAQTLIQMALKNDPQFDARKLFLTDIYPKVMTPEKEAEYVRSLFKADYEAKFKPDLIKARQALDTEINAKKKEMDAACKPDVLSQVLRGTIGNALAMLGNNWSAAQNEKGDIAKYYRATTGISIADIQKYGIQGGPGSEMNKILGGEKSVAREVINALDPSKWKVTVKIDPPNTSPGPLVETKVGGTRVCIPWC